MIPAVSAVGGGSYQDYVVAAGNYQQPVGTYRARLGAYPFSASTGWGTRFADPSITGTSLSSPNNGRAGFGPQSEAAGANFSTQTPPTYAFSAAGWGTQYSTPATAPTQGTTTNEYVFYPSGSLVAIGGNTSPYMNVYAWSNATGFGARYGNPGTLPSSTVSGIAFNGSSFVCSFGTTSPYVRGYAWSAGFGSAFSAPATTVGGSANAIRFNETGDTLLVGSTASAYLHAYPWSNSTGWGTKYANMATLPTQSVTDVAWNTAGNVVLAAQNGATNGVIAYAWSAGFGTKYANPATLNTSGVNVDFNFDGTAVISSASSQLNAWAWSGGFGTKYADPATMTDASNAKFNHY